MTDPGRCLTGWRSIAEYLEVSVRTAQAYHRRLQLPIVYSSPSLVSAVPLDLEKWKVTRLAPALERFSSTSKEPRVQAPRNAEFLFHLFMTPQNCDALVGDLEERYKLIHKKFGRRRANLWYWTQTVASVAPIVWTWAKKIPMKPVGAVVGWALAKGMIGHDGWLAGFVEMVKRVGS